MKKFAFSLLLFSAFAAIFYTVALMVLPSFFKMNLSYKPGSLGFMNSRTKDLQSIEKTDILFFGSSHAYRGFDTRIFDSAGFRSFNLGSSIQTPIQTQLLLEKYLARLSPKTVIYEVSTIAFSSDAVESSLDLIANDKISLGTIKMAIEINNIKTYNTLLYALCRQIFNSYENFYENPIRGEDTYIKGGFVEHKMGYFQHKVHRSEKIILNENLLTYFDKNLKYINERGIKIILVQAPITSASYRAYTNIHEFDSIMKSKKYPYYNFNETIQLDDSLNFLDDHHLNQSGVKILDSVLIQIIKEKDK